MESWATRLMNIQRTSDEVAAHEDHGQLVAVFVVAPPDGVVLLVELVPEVRNGLVGVVVGIEPLEVVHVEVALGHRCERVLGRLLHWDALKVGNLKLSRS